MYGIVGPAGSPGPSNDEQTNLERAIDGGDVEAAKKALDAGADPSSTDEWGATPLHMACSRSSVEILDLLVEKGADPNASNESEETCLFMAARDGSLEVLGWALDKGLDPNTKDDMKRTPLLMALLGSRVSAKKVSLLIEKEADASYVKKTETLLHTFYREGCVAFDSPDCPALEVVKALVEAGADPKAQNHWKETPLHLAAGVRHLETVKYLVEKGADVNAKHTDGYTPLDYAHETPYETMGVKEKGVGEDTREAVIAFLKKKGGKKSK